MKVIFKAKTSKEERVLFSLLAIAIILVLWFLNSKYLYLEDCEFEDDVCSKIIVRAGFILKKQVELTPAKDTPVSGVIPNYGYSVDIIPLMDDKSKPTGEYNMTISKSGKVCKALKIYKDDYYQKYYKSPLGKI